ncbi:uncharacterized protein L201_007150 [Kwoniella dendrophila CBS 6074]|uniref:BZIP domain-containing protein n=1 Tax=Kwoniella dendrophila CBS 6074 TaxID=1295534 RepID=A0AAX4K3M8_9TREE
MPQSAFIGSSSPSFAEPLCLTKKRDTWSQDMPGSTDYDWYLQKIDGEMVSSPEQENVLSTNTAIVHETTSPEAEERVSFDEDYWWDRSLTPSVERYESDEDYNDSSLNVTNAVKKQSKLNRNTEVLKISKRSKSATKSHRERYRKERQASWNTQSQVSDSVLRTVLEENERLKHRNTELSHTNELLKNQVESAYAWNTHLIETIKGNTSSLFEKKLDEEARLKCEIQRIFGNVMTRDQQMNSRLNHLQNEISSIKSAL